ncbi:MAG: hypothetical protein ACXWQO_06580 [Bdellovibrionota bacterium]
MTRYLNIFCFVAALCLLPFTGHASTEPETDSTVGASYRARYPLSTASQKLVDNQGNGFDALYGVRNMRAVLNGVYYRGGANNAFNKHGKRSNSNPLPAEGLVNLCKEGFGHAVYLYPDRFSTAAKITKCRMKDNTENVLTYKQISPLSYNKADLDELHGLIFEHVRNPRLGAIYDHCWNGWHASGYVAATALRQFCGFTAAQAVNYWNINTDGNDKESGFENIRQRIRNFTVNPNMQLSSAEKTALCPAPASLSFQ